MRIEKRWVLGGNVRLDGLGIVEEITGGSKILVISSGRVIVGGMNFCVCRACCIGVIRFQLLVDVIEFCS